ncbi:MAG: hypothetical protein EHM61_01435 [Acidobacteria bacterium]|nr:MAG: hypothetical protein EHM61_01435 [Acidobacteriota bacterium]
MNRKRILVVLAALPLLLLTACDLDTVAEVKGDPYKFTKDTAHLGGIVTKSYGVMGYGIYEIEDKTGKIFVVAEGRGVPARGTKVEVRGKAKNAFTFAGFDYGTVLLESDRKIHD